MARMLFETCSRCWATRSCSRLAASSACSACSRLTGAFGGLEPAVPSEASGAVSDCPLCTQPPGRDEDVHVYLQHCVATGHPVRGRGSWRGNAPLIMRPGVSLRFFER